MVTAKTFPMGGIHPPEHKEATAQSRIREIARPQELVVPLSQHTGAPCEPLVKVGDRIIAGQKIGESESFIAAPVHTPVSGVVTAIEKRVVFSGAQVVSVVISPDAEQVWVDEVERDWSDLTAEEIRVLVRDAGIVGLGGAAFPSSVKLTPPKDKPIDTVIINGCECEPFLTCDQALLRERSADLIEASKLLARVVNAQQVVIAIEDNKPEEIKLLSSMDEAVKVIACAVKYPQGSEKQLIKAVTGREVPLGKLPSEVGVLVHNVGTALAILDAVTRGKALVERVLTVTGAVNEPGNVKVLIGTPISHVIEQCGGFRGDPGKVILGGPMTGWAVDDLSVPVQKGTSGILVLSQDYVTTHPVMDCVRCAACLDACPMGLTPNMIATSAEHHKYAEAEQWGVMDCFECGSCSYVCPSNRPIVGWVREAKKAVNDLRRSKQKAG